MASISDLNGKLIAPNASQPGDDEAHHQSIAPTNEELPQAARREKIGGGAEIANNPRIHEIIQDEAIYSTAVLIGK
jgi:hypothetical protein